MSCNVLVDGNGAAVGHGAPAHGQRPAVLKLVDHVAGVGKKRFLYAIPDVFFRIRWTGAGSDSELQNFRKGYSWLYGVGSKAIHRAVKLVGEHELCVGSEHADAVRHVRERRVQKHIGMLEAFSRRLALHLSPDAQRRYACDQQGQQSSNKIA